MVSNALYRVTSYLQSYGFTDFLLPFLLVFTIIFAVLQKTKILGDEKKNFNVVVALVLALLFVIPHLTGAYPMGYDPVQVLNETLPSISLVAVAAIMVLLLMGIFGADFLGPAKSIVAVVAIAFVVYIFGASLNFWTGPYDIFNWWSSEVTELVVILLVFGLIVMWITKDDSEKKEKEEGKGFGDMLSKYLGAKGKED